MRSSGKEVVAEVGTFSTFFGSDDSEDKLFALLLFCSQLVNAQPPRHHAGPHSQSTFPTFLLFNNPSSPSCSRTNEDCATQLPSRLTMMKNEIPDASTETPADLVKIINKYIVRVDAEEGSDVKERKKYRDIAPRLIGITKSSKTIHCQLHSNRPS